MKEYKEVKHQFFLVLNEKEIFWRQRSKQLWLASGDKNTKYFHAACTTRKRNNTIQRLRDDTGSWVDWQNGLETLICNYYDGLFTVAPTEVDEIIDCVPSSISHEQNAVLTNEISREEVGDALFQMHPDKAPGPDGMTPTFFQRHWKIVGEDIFNLVRNFFATGDILCNNRYF